MAEVLKCIIFRLLNLEGILKVVVHLHMQIFGIHHSDTSIIPAFKHFILIYIFARKILRVEKDFTIPPAKTVLCHFVALNDLKTTLVTKGQKCVVRMASVQQTEIPAYNS